ncbi:MAG: hypothetical protein QXM68_03615 [Candidatus Aenigmatarchaeota archaeon]|nr:hypothetical protein [Candidatus Aenigmarchaeota archaeon]
MKKLLLVILLSISIVKAQNFDLWAERGGPFTIGEPQIIKIYVLNRDNQPRSYTITYFKSATYQSNDVSHLMYVNFPSYTITNVKPGQTASTELTLFLASPVSQGTITFRAINEVNDQREFTLQGIRASYPQSLPEFNLVFLFVLLLFASWKYLKILQD